MSNRRHNHCKIAGQPKIIEKKIPVGYIKCPTALCAGRSKNIASNKQPTIEPDLALKDRSESLESTKKKVAKASKLPILVGRKIQNTLTNGIEGSFNFKGKASFDNRVN